VTRINGTSVDVDALRVRGDYKSKRAFRVSQSLAAMADVARGPRDDPTTTAEQPTPPH